MNKKDQHVAVRCLQTSCYALFSDQSARKINLDAYEESSTVRIVPRSTTTHTSIRASAECGFSAALNQFEHRVERTGKNYGIVWEFEGKAGETQNFDGLSAGLAFFTVFLVQLIGQCCLRHPSRKRPGPTFAVAATGILSGATSKARIDQVAHFHDKLRAALKVLQRGDKLLYPLGNREEISGDAAAALEAAGIELIPVATPGEAAAIIIHWFLEDGCEPPEWLRRIRALLIRRGKSRTAIAAGCVAVLLLLYLLVCRPFICTGTRLRTALENGEFDKIKICARGRSSDPDIALLLRQMRTPLSLTSSFIYTEEDRPLLGDADALDALQNVVIDSTKGYRFEIQTDKPCYFYLFQFADDSTLDLLFPASEFELANHWLPDNQLFMIPGGINFFFFAGTAPRHLVTLCFLGTLWRARDIEELYAQYSAANQPGEMKNLRDRLLQRILKRSQALQKGLKGLYYHQSFFWRQ